MTFLNYSLFCKNLFQKNVRFHFRNYHLSCVNQSSNSTLWKLRKHTGFSFSVCRDALQRNENDLEKAIEWLREISVRKGWEKVGKLSGRSLYNGTLGLLYGDRHAVVLEVNCETDFVVRNTDFQKLVAKATKSVFNHFEDYDPLVTHATWNQEQLQAIKFDQSSTLGDQLALTIGSIGENMSIQRALGFAIPIDKKDSQFLSTYAHQASSDTARSYENVVFGKYASLLRYECTLPEVSEEWCTSTKDFSRKLCQHIVGLNPKSGCLEEPEVENELKSDVDSEFSSDNLKVDSLFDKREPLAETRLLFQPYLHDESLKVHEAIRQHSMRLLDFTRLEVAVDEESNEQDDKSQSEEPSAVSA